MPEGGRESYYGGGTNAYLIDERENRTFAFERAPNLHHGPEIDRYFKTSFN